MGLILLKKITLLFLLLSTSFVSISCAGRRWKVANQLGEEVDDDANEELSSNPLDNEKATIHDRLLKDNTKDYGKYDPAPALVRPPFKLIPN